MVAMQTVERIQSLFDWGQWVFASVLHCLGHCLWPSFVQLELLNRMLLQVVCAGFSKSQLPTETLGLCLSKGTTKSFLSTWKSQLETLWNTYYAASHPSLVYPETLYTLIRSIRVFLWKLNSSVGGSLLLLCCTLFIAYLCSKWVFFALFNFQVLKGLCHANALRHFHSLQILHLPFLPVFASLLPSNMQRSAFKKKMERAVIRTPNYWIHLTAELEIKNLAP